MNTRWYNNKELLIAAKEEYGSLDAVATAIGGVAPSTLQKAWRRHGLESLTPGPAPKPPVNEEALRRVYARLSS